MKTLLLTLLACGFFVPDAFAENGVVGSWYQQSTNSTFTIVAHGKTYSLTQKFSTGQERTYKLVPIGRKSADKGDARGVLLQRKFDDPGVFFRQPETYFIQPDGTLTVNYSAESASLPPVK
ncbi:MAG: hypothetical protein LBR31_04905 [Desulfovibrio sp.]|jgi:hypothetical protein|nr:hypothetical protein [Desulfovibrio sp.]